MPVIAVVAAVVAVESAVVATTVWSVITAVGAVTSAIGAVTGNEKLMKIGAVVGIAGAVGGFASGAGFFGGEGAAASGIDAANNAAADSLIGANDLGSTLSNDIGGTLNAGLETPSGMIGQAAETAAPALDAALPAAQSAAVTGIPDVAPPTVTPQINTGAVDTTVNANPVDNLPPTDTSGMSKDIASTFNSNLQTPQVNPLAPPTPFDNLMGMFGKMGSAVGDFAKTNPMLASSIFSGVASAADPSQRNLRDAQTNNLNANAAMTNQQRQNQNSVGGTIDWNKIFKPAGMIGKGG